MIQIHLCQECGAQFGSLASGETARTLKRCISASFEPRPR
jgi:hypothetical protein